MQQGRRACGSERYFGLHTLGPGMQGRERHKRLLAAYDKLFA